SAPRRLGTADEILPADQRVIATPTQVYARPDLSSFAWASLRRGITVQALRHAPGFEQVEYVEYDQEPARHFITMRIRGWVPAETLAHARRRTFFHLTCLADTPARWTTFADNHTFTLFWAPLDALPPIVPPQAAWPAWLK
ncbi:MAG: hypothetical protein KC708_26280, partial [Anaerolineae bacterium]|nr:hypothetical protein [Anaerolineae bacterium]